ncbi:hypothetical protein RYH73_07020 [Olivibacter sp. CPCC 100613]|uniref:alpha-1,3-galactosidase-related protein n=1 Tax=Olivibacter sp. CPCC 100613 TaxID=3079931 RepID=UPI002FF9EB5D
MKKFFLSVYCCLILCAVFAQEDTVRYRLEDYGLHPNTRQNSSPLFVKALKEITRMHPKGKPLLLTLCAGRYDFYPEEATERSYYISNHDQDNPKIVGLPFEQLSDMTFDGQGADLIFHGRMLPVSLIDSRQVTLRNFHIDFESPHIGQAIVLENDTIKGTISLQMAPWMKYRIENGVFYHMGEGWEHNPGSGIAFEEKTKRIVFNTSDIEVKMRQVREIRPGIIQAGNWKNSKLVPGTVLALRGAGRPAPGVFVYHGTNILLERIAVHYAEGMGLLAQVTENIRLNKFSVNLRGPNDPRYFTTQADATHFSGCKGKIISTDGLYEGMMDDAINVHGTYLKVVGHKDDHTLVGAYMHPQSYGFEWGRSGDAVQFIAAKTMETVAPINYIERIKPVDRPTYDGAKCFEIVFKNPIDPIINEESAFGMENLEWTPEIFFANNVVRNNRARGALFSTPKKTVVENNLFDHTSGTAILLCGDCNGWFETGGCHDVIIRHNRFVNALTNLFQFTNAVISIYPEIPDLAHQTKFFHHGIVIEGNEFETFDSPLVYAKSVDGLLFKQNTVKHNDDYKAFHWNQSPFLFEHVKNVKIVDNQFDKGFNKASDVKYIGR